MLAAAGAAAFFFATAAPLPAGEDVFLEDIFFCVLSAVIVSRMCDSNFSTIQIYGKGVIDILKDLGLRMYIAARFVNIKEMTR